MDADVGTVERLIATASLLAEISDVKDGFKLVEGAAKGLKKFANKADDVSEKVGKLAEKARGAGKDASKNAGRTGKKQKLKDIANDPNASSADRGWINQEINAIGRKSKNQKGNPKKHIRNPPGKDLAHERGREAAKGFGYEHSNLQDRDLHKLQHKHDDYGRKNKIRN